MNIKVVDTGIGIPEQSQPLIFEIFHQLDSSKTRNYEGLGLGLYIVKRLADLIGAKLKVKSRVGQGSSFSVVLPLGDGDRAEPLSTARLDPLD